MGPRVRGDDAERQQIRTTLSVVIARLDRAILPETPEDESISRGVRIVRSSRTMTASGLISVVPDK
jgi:hypothetical protein